MEIKTTEEIHEIEIPECPDVLMEEMMKKKIPSNGTICRKCKYDSLCNKKWVSVDDLQKEFSSVMNTRNNEKAMRLLIIEIGLKFRKGEK